MRFPENSDCVIGENMVPFRWAWIAAFLVVSVPWWVGFLWLLTLLWR